MQLRTILQIDADLTGMPFGEHAQHYAMQELGRLIGEIVEDYFTGYPASVTVLALQELNEALERIREERKGDHDGAL